SARPLYSIAISSAEGADGILYGQASLRTGSGNAPPSLAYSARMRLNRSATISMSPRASPGASAPFQCHCSQPPELVIEPSSSAKQVAGSRITVVWISAVLTSLCSPKPRQNSAVSVLSGSMVASHFSLDSPATTFFLFGKEPTGLKPWQM